jgi:16S rRNA (guanine527-N7)-methyltransferase
MANTADTDWDSFDATLLTACAAAGLEVDEPTRRRMFAHYELVTAVNRQFNLTRITTPADAAVKHYADSLTLLAIPGLGDSLEVLDVGTGAGFPAVPLAMVRPQWTVTAIDGTGKKIRFVAESAGQLGLSNVEAIHARAADLAQAGRRQWDLVLLRAVTQLAPGLKEVHRLVKAGGRVVFYKTASTEPTELHQGHAAAAQYGFVEEEAVDLVLPAPDGPLARRLVVYRRKPG